MSHIREYKDGLKKDSNLYPPYNNSHPEEQYSGNKEQHSYHEGQNTISAMWSSTT